MKKTFILAVALLLGTMVSWAEPVSRDQARQVAEAFWSHKTTNVPQLVDVTPAEFTLVRVFAGADGHGFVIVSLDDIARPILGYSLTSPIDATAMPEPTKAWLDEYQNEMVYYRDVDAKQSAQTGHMWRRLKGEEPYEYRAPGSVKSVQPLVTAKWNQTRPYNTYCPGGSVTGCVATAGAMIMHHWRWPLTGEGSHSYQSNYGRLSVNFANETYDWANMPDYLTTSSSGTEITAVATLMYDIGVAVEMNYSPESSGAQAVGTVGDPCMFNAYKDYFRYNKRTVRTATYNEYVYEEDEWTDMLKEELDAGRPMQYNGCDISGSGCHSFVMDGYDEDGNFSINWGWGGSYDGYFAFGALTPAGSGTGGNDSDNYTHNNRVILGIQPENVAVDDVQTESYGVYTEDGCAVVTNDGDPVEVAIYDMTGARIYFGRQTEQMASYRISKPGVYVVMVNSEPYKVAIN